MVAAGVPPSFALGAWAAWASGYACSVLAVHRVLARHRVAASWIDLGLGLVLASVAGVAVCVPRGPVALPLVITALVVVAHPPRASRLRAVGVALVIASVVSDVLLVGA
jgi:hypothetical protein